MRAPWSVIFRPVRCYRFEASHLRKGPHERHADVAGSVETRIIRVQTLDRNVRRCLKNKHVFNFQPMHFCWEKPRKEDRYGVNHWTEDRYGVNHWTEDRYGVNHRKEDRYGVNHWKEDRYGVNHWKEDRYGVNHWTDKRDFRSQYTDFRRLFASLELQST